MSTIALMIMVGGGTPATSIPPSATPPIVIEGNRPICEYAQSTGSILPKKICKTKDRWDRERAAGKAFADQRARELTTYQQIQIQIEQRKKNPP